MTTPDPIHVWDGTKWVPCVFEERSILLSSSDRVYTECKDGACRSRKAFGRHKHCRGCDYPIAVDQGGDYCGECMCEDDME